MHLFFFFKADFALYSFAYKMIAKCATVCCPVSPSESLNQRVNGLKSGDTLNKIRIRKGE